MYYIRWGQTTLKSVILDKFALCTFCHQTLHTALDRCLDHFQSKKMSKYHIVTSFLMTSKKTWYTNFQISSHLIYHLKEHDYGTIILSFFFTSQLLYVTNRFHVAISLFNNRSKMTSKCGENKKVAHGAIAKCVSVVLTMFCDLLLIRRAATWNLFVLYNNETSYYR